MIHLQGMTPISTCGADMGHRKESRFYADFVSAICKPGEQIKLSPRDAHVIHMLLGLCGEAGELVDAIKKNAIYGKTLDMANVKEELGDIEFFLQGIRNAYSLMREDIVAGNIEKLQKRYSSGTYSNEQANARADKAPVLGSDGGGLQTSDQVGSISS